MEIEINLFADWINIIKSELIERNYDISGLDNDKISINYFALEKKAIPIKPRNVLISDIFECPLELNEGLELLKQKIILGEDLRPFQSRKLKVLTDKDGMLFDWDIHHLHLGKELQSDGFIERTGPLLYIRFDNDFAYFINILSHGAWTAQDLLKTIHRNWPESIETFRVKDVIGVERNFSDNDLKHMRNAQINTILELAPGAIYIGPGWGVAASGDSNDAVMKHLDQYRAFQKLEREIKSDYLNFLSPVFQNLDFITTDKLKFKLEKRDGLFYLYEELNDFEVQISR